MLTIPPNYYPNNINHIPSKRSMSPSFCSNYTITKSLINPYSTMTKNATCFFRCDLDWKKFCKLILSNFKKDEKLNIVCVPCSDGSEPVSLLLKLLQFNDFKERFKNFDCIKAYDIDKTQLDIAKSGKIPFINDLNLGLFDLNSLFIHARKSLNKHYSIKNGCIELADEIKDKIQYEQKDIETVVKDIPKDEKVVLLARNIFPYLSDFFYYDNVMRGLSKLKEGSLLVIGDYDRKIQNIEKDILKQGYKKTSIKNCYIKCENISDSILSKIAKQFNFTFNQKY